MICSVRSSSKYFFPFKAVGKMSESYGKAKLLSKF